MTPALILWVHALAAILFTTLALDQWRRGEARALVAALALTALWALAVAGIGPLDVATRVMEGARDLAWLWMGVTLARRDRELGSAGLLAFIGAACLPLALIGIALAQAADPLADPLANAPAHASAYATARLALRTLTAFAGLFILRAAIRARGPDRFAAALAMLWGVDLVAFAPAWVIGWSPTMTLARGAAMIGVGAAFALATQPATDRRFDVSRPLRIRLLAGGALVLYTGGVVAATGIAASFGGEHARALQTAIIAGAAATLLALVSTPWLRAWTRVVVEKNLFGHRYDYRVAWRRFTGTLGRPGEDGPLPQRIVKATADLIDSPAGLLLARTDTGLEPAAQWRWDGDARAIEGEALSRHLEYSGRVLELDSVRNGTAPPADAQGVPDWLLAETQAWTAVPLVHVGSLVGVILLARPPVSRALDWEDFDLLRLAGRQAASYLAEDRAHSALADAERFDEFNRRFAFILHDIKNLASQVTLVARNAERHADNPDFRADMIATLRDSSERMTTLIARLSHRAPTAGQPGVVVDATELIGAMARSRRAQHALTAEAEGPVLVLASSGALAQAIGHLVQNAVEASPADAPVTLRSSVANGRAVIEVVDRGSGMSPAFVRDQLFRPFSSSKSDGFGLGAFEARQLVRAMGGRLDVDSREGEGTRFRITLPLAPALEAAA